MSDARDGQPGFRDADGERTYEGPQTYNPTTTTPRGGVWNIYGQNWENVRDDPSESPEEGL